MEHEAMTPPIPTEKADMNAKHTKGPWRVTRSAYSGLDLAWSIEAPDAESSSLAEGDRGLWIAHVDFVGDDESKANAALIAAAPDLRETLEELLSFESAFEFKDKENAVAALECCIKARAALAKANGAQ